MGKYIVSELNPSLFKPNLQIITPNSAIAHYIRQITHSQVKISHYSLESLTQNIVRRQGWGIASVLLSRRLLQNAVKQVISTKDIEGTAKAFLTAIKDLFRSGIDLQQLQQNTDPRIQQLASLAIAYQAQLRHRKRIDAAELYWQGAIDIAYQKPYLFYGYFAPTKDELAIVNAIADQDSILVLPTDDLYPQNQKSLAWLQSQGWEFRETKRINHKLQECFKQKASLPPGVSLNVFSNLEEEIRGVLTQVKILLTQGVEAKDIVLVTNDEQLYGETLIDVAEEYSLPVQVAYDIPLEKTRMGAWLKLLLEVLRDNFPFETTAKLLSHPLARYMSAEIWSTAREIHPQGLAAWQELEVDLSLLDLTQNSYSREFWIERLQDILTTWDILEKGKFWAREMVAFYCIQDALNELSNPKEQVISKQTFVNEINEILALLTTNAQPGTGGIKLYNPTSLLGTSYPYVFFLGSASSILPTEITNDTILDFYSRKQLVKQGLEIVTAVDIAQRETFYFYCFLNIATQQITFSYPELVDRAFCLPSPYLTRLGLQPTPLDILPLASIESARQKYLRCSSLLDEATSLSLKLPNISKAWQVEAARESTTAPDEYDGVIGIAIDPQSKIFSASQLTQLGQCPFKWFSARLLKLKELNEAESDLSPAFRGSLYHRCLELSLAQIKTAKDLAKFNREQLVKAFETAEKELKLTQLAGWEAQRQEHLDLLSLNLASIDFLPPEREVIATETKFDTQWYGLEVQGQVDRIDRTDAGLAIIDYKTSSLTPPGVKDETGKANLDIQLAVYQDAIAEKHPAETIDTAAYYSITKQKTISSPQKDPAQLSAFAERVKSHLQQGHYPVDPDIDRKACRYCNYDFLCRQGDRLSRKNQ
ncbi:PD-(D/E)XK nuclease family protein [Waterburya agarophytonicola K14]|uniref:PD-(D/E)XK nuclease family protein n=1 Tax=Waterburya agarophytonicola KI4 TaxID=2874699 RepID=A0A964BRP8_9CYAN|nr:PD-(D/E)XK nuclease family protein [Waterburya agarophytonicola]MCC0177532.1 PD-(D/E)XK nuclease family protein [Waterburya agarophytonicola KI4]